MFDKLKRKLGVSKGRGEREASDGKPNIDPRQVRWDFLNEHRNIKRLCQIKELIEDEDLTGIQEQMQRLERLGFTESSNYHELERKMDQLRKASFRNTEREITQRAMDHFLRRYPANSPITEEGVGRLCEKHGLKHDIAEKFCGEVPREKVEEMERLDISPEEEVFLKTCTGYDLGPQEYRSRVMLEKGGAQKADFLDRESYFFPNEECEIRVGNVYWMKSPMEVVAPPEMFDAPASVPEEDPVVLQPVFFEGEKYYLVAAAWDPGANTNGEKT